MNTHPVGDLGMVCLFPEEFAVHGFPSTNPQLTRPGLEDRAGEAGIVYDSVEEDAVWAVIGAEHWRGVDFVETPDDFWEVGFLVAG